MNRSILGLLAAWSAVAGLADEPKTHTVAPEPLRIEVTVKGTVESSEMAPLVAKTKEWTDLVIKEVAAEGTTVKRGDVVIAFETDKIERRVRDAELAVRLAELALQGTELEIAELEKTFVLDMQAADRALQYAKDDFRHYEEVDRPLQVKFIESSFKNSEFSLENAREELAQLKKMYEEDELVEESENIVLRRQQRQVEQAELSFEAARVRFDRSMNVELVREMEQRVTAMERAQIQFEKTRSSLDLAREKKHVELAKARSTLEQEQTKLADIKADMEMMVLKAPQDGLVYHGQCLRGEWQGTAGNALRTLEPGKPAPANKTLITIVDPRLLFLHADLSEAQLADLNVGMTGTATPASHPDTRLDAEVAALTHIPLAAGKFDCRINVAWKDTALNPGMTCEAKFTAYDKKDALVVPTAAVFYDEHGNPYVWIHVPDKPPEKRGVRKGRNAGDKTEILDGVVAGDVVRMEAPK